MVSTLRSAISRARPGTRWTRHVVGTPDSRPPCSLRGYQTSDRPSGTSKVEPNTNPSISDQKYPDDPLEIWRWDHQPVFSRTKLLPMLRVLGCAEDIPGPSSRKKNLGYGRENRETRRREIWAQHQEEQYSATQTPGITLSGMSVRFLYQKVWPKRHELSRKGYPFKLESFGLTDEAQKYLESRNADWSDFSFWAYVLLGRNGPEAITRLEWLCKKRKYRLPVFVVNHALRHLAGHNIHTIRTAISCIDKYLTRNEEIVKTLDKPSLRVDAVTKRILFLRLFRLANYYFPRELLSVAKAYVKHSLEGPHEITKNDIIFCNHILWAVGDPPRLSSPYWSSLPYIVDAQVYLLQKMFQMDPIMNLDRKGFRGIVRTRLAAPRTPAEKSIIAHQGMNWPPWKEIIDGYDQTYSRIDPDNDEPNVGSAGLVLREIQRAGYPLREWEHSAMVLSGMDKSGQPTVPRRTWFVAGSSSGEDNVQTIWQARIRATRTLNEAWRIFLQYSSLPISDNTSRAASVHVYKEMFRKLIQARKQDWERPEPVEESEEPRSKPKVGIHRFLPDDELVYVPPEPKPDPTGHYLRTRGTTIRGPTDIKYGSNISDNVSVNIGDSKDLLQPPRNPARGAHVPIPPPTIEELWSSMLRRGIKPDLGLTTLLVRHAPEAAEAHMYLDEWYSYPRRRQFQKQKVDKYWRWWLKTDPAELEKLHVVQFGTVLPWSDKAVASHCGEGAGEADEKIKLSIITIELVSAYIAGITSTTFSPRKAAENSAFTQHLIFRSIPKAINIAKSFGITQSTTWTAILKGLNYSRLPRGLFSSSDAKSANDLYASTGFWEGGINRKLKFRDLNFCVARIYQHLFEQSVVFDDPALVYEFTIAAERGWEFEQHLLRDNQARGHKAMAWRVAHVVDLFERMVGIRMADGRFVSDEPSENQESKDDDVAEDTLDAANNIADTANSPSEVKPTDNTTEDIGISRKTLEWQKDYQELVKISATTGGKSTLPPLVIPRTAHVHAYIRLVLKTAQDNYDPVVRLLRWMVRYIDFLDVKNRRLTLIALRALWNLEVIFVSDGNGGVGQGHLEALEKGRINYETAMRLVNEGLREWGGWASDVEVAAYNGDDWRVLREVEESTDKARHHHHQPAEADDAWRQADDFDDVL